MALDAKKLEQLSAYLDGELTPTERAEVERLIEQDADARVYLSELRRVSRWIGDLPRLRGPEPMTGAILERLERLERESLLGEAASPSVLRFGRYSRMLGIAASVLIVCTVGWFSLPQFQSVNKSSRSDLKVDRSTLAEKTEPRGPSAESSRQSSLPSPAAQSERLAVQQPRTTRGDSDGRGWEESQDRAISENGDAGSHVAIATGNSKQKVERDQSEQKDSATAAEQPAADYPLSAKEPAPSANTITSLAYSPATALAIDLPTIDSKLANNQVSLHEVQAAPVQSFQNRLDIEVDDAATVTRLASLIESNMGRYQVENLEDAAKNEVIRNDQSFWLARPVTTSDRESQFEKQIPHALNDAEDAVKPGATARGDQISPPDSDEKPSQNKDARAAAGRAPDYELNESKDAPEGYSRSNANRNDASVTRSADDEAESPADGQVFVINVPREQAAPLIRSIQTLVEQCDSIAVWVANSEPVTADRPAEEAVRRLVSPALFDRSDEQRTGRVSDAPAGETTEEGAIGATPRRGQPIATSRPSDSGNSPSPLEVFGGAPTTPEANPQFVTLAISLRTNPRLRSQNARPDRAPAENPPPAAAAARAASQPAEPEPESGLAPATKQTADQPTSRGATRD
ncbi:MAG: zf-HC2 domain-containing protein [Phycisphaerae bacterium]|nr:zf-HC2 domain-containing protein [Phycisphaerae bacterium]